MTFTVRDWLTRSLRLGGILAEGEPMQPAQSDTALVVASELLDGWRTERLTIYSQGRHIEPLTAGQQDYTLGLTGQWNHDRPLWVDRASFLTAAGLEQQITLYTDDEWAAIPIKSVPSSLPFGVYINETYPLATASVFPVPTDQTVSVVLYTPDASIVSVSDVNTTLSVPPGWAKALRYNLAVDFCAEWQVAAPDLVASIATTSKGNIKRTNAPNDQMRIEPALRRMGGRRAMTHAEFLAGE